MADGEVVVVFKADDQMSKAADELKSKFDSLSGIGAKIFLKEDIASYKTQLVDSSNAIKNSLVSTQAQTMKLKTDIKASAMEQLKADNDMIQSKGKLSKANTDMQKSVQLVAKEMLHEEKVTRALGDANSYVEKTFAGVSKGALTLADAEQKLTQNAKAVAQEIMSLKKEIEASGKATGDQVAKLKQLESALDTYKEAADEAGDAQLEFNRMMQNADERLSGNAKSVGMFGASLAGLSGTIGGAGGMLADFAGSAANAANQFGGMMDQLKAGKDMKGFQGMMTQATAAVGMAQVGIQAVMQIYTMIDGAIRKTEQATMDAGKDASKQMGSISNYMLGDKDVGSRLDLVDKLSESNLKLGNSLRAVSMDSEKFEAALAKANEKLRTTKELGLAMEWKTGQTGGGLLGWLKDTTGDLQKWSIEVGKALASIDEIRQKAAEADKAYNSAVSTYKSAADSFKSKIMDLDIQLAKAHKNQAEVDRLEIQKIRDEGDKTLLALKEQETKIAELQRGNSAELRKLQNQQQQAVTNLNQDLQENMTGQAQSIARGLGFSLDTDKRYIFINKMRDSLSKLIEDNMDAIRSGDMLMESTEKDGKHIAGLMEKMFDDMAKSADPSKLKVFMATTGATLKKYGADVSTYGRALSAALNDNSIKGFLSTLNVTMPAIAEATDLAGKYTKQLAEVGDQYDIVKGQIDIVVSKTKELWALERQDKSTKPSSLEKFSMPQLANMDKEVQYWLDTLKGRYEGWGDKVDTGKIKKAIADRSKELATYIAKDNTLQDALKAQQTKLAELEKKLPSLTGSARTEAEKQIQSARGSILALTEELNSALMQTAHLRADIILASQEAIKDVSNLDSMTTIQTQMKDWQSEIDKIQAGYGNLSTAGKLAADTQIAALKGVIATIADQGTALAVAVRTAAQAGESVLKGLEESYTKAEAAWNIAHDMRSQDQKDEEAFQKQLADTTKYYDDQIKAFHDKGIFGTSDIVNLEHMRDAAVDLIKNTHDLVAATKEYEALWKSVASTMTDSQKLHMDWLKTFDIKGYEAAQKALEKTKLEARIQGFKSTRDALEKEMIATGDSEAFRAKVKEMTGGLLVLTGDKKADWEALWKFFDQMANEASDLAGYTKDTAGNLKEIAKSAGEATDKLTGFAAKLKESGEKANELFNWKPTFDLTGFLEDFDKAINGSTSDIADTLTEKFNDDMKGVNDSLSKAMADSNKAFETWLADKEKGMTDAQKKEFEMSDEYFAKLQETNNKIVELTQSTADKRLAIMQKNALDLANAYKTEFDKLEQLQETFDNRMKVREQKMGDAKLEVQDYVARSKMTKGQKEADDIAKQLADQYQKYREAGMSEADLTEWLAAKKKELLTGKDKETTAEFEKQWAIRKKTADAFVQAEAEKFDAETSRMQTAIDKQTELVDKLKNLADAAKQSLIDMLTQLGVAITEVGNAGSGGSTGTVTAEPMNFVLKDGMRYSQVKGNLDGSNMPSQSLRNMIGKNGVTDLIYKGAPHNAWVTYPSQYNGGTGGSADAGTGTGASSSTGGASTSDTSVSAHPIESSAEINARIEGYKQLETLAKTVEAELQTWVTTTKQLFTDFFTKDFSMKPSEEPAKSWIGNWATSGAEAVKAFKTKLEDYFVKKLIAWEAADWGVKTMTNFGIGLETGASSLGEKVFRILATKIKPYFPSSPAKQGPLKELYNWGVKTWQNFAEGLDSGAVYVEDSITRLTGTIGSVFTGLGSNIAGSITGGIETGLTAVKGVKGVGINSDFATEILGLPTLEGSSQGDVFASIRERLLQSDTMKGLYSERKSFNADTDKNYAAFKDFLDTQTSKTTTDMIAGFVNGDLTQKSDREIYSWFMTNFDKQLIPPDLGEVGIEHVRKQVEQHPELKEWYPYQRKLQEQYPELLQELFRQNILIPVTATRIVADDKGVKYVAGGGETEDIKKKYGTKGSVEFDPAKHKTVGWYQEGNVYDRNLVDSDMMNVNGALTFSDWMQEQFNESGDAGAGLSDWYGARMKFLDNFGQSRITELVSKYQKYLQRTTGVAQTSQEKIEDLVKKYKGTDIADKIASGTAVDEALSKDGWATLLDSKFVGRDKEVLAGGAWYDKEGNKVTDTDLLKQLMSPKSYGSKLTGYTYKDTYETVKGDYAGGVGQLKEFFAGLDEEQRGKIMESMTARIEDYWKDTSTSIGGYTEASGDGGVANPGTTFRRNNSLMRDAAKAQAARLLGYSEEFVIAKGWDILADNTDATNLAYEEMLKNIELLDEQLVKLAGTSEDVTNAQAELADANVARVDVIGSEPSLSAGSQVMTFIQALLNDPSSYRTLSQTSVAEDTAFTTLSESAKNAVNQYLKMTGDQQDLWWESSRSRADKSNVSYTDSSGNAQIWKHSDYQGSLTPEQVKQNEYLDEAEKYLLEMQTVQESTTSEVYALRTDILNEIRMGLQEALGYGDLTLEEANSVVKQLMPKDISIPKEIAGMPGYNPSENLQYTPWGAYGNMYNEGTKTMIGSRYWLGNSWLNSERQGFGALEFGKPGIQDVGQSTGFDPYLRQQWLGNGTAGYAPVNPLGMAYMPAETPTSSYSSQSTGATYVYLTFQNTRIEGVGNLEEAIVTMVKKYGWNIKR